MKISEFKNQEYVGYFVEHDKDIRPKVVGTPHNWKRKLKLVTDHPLAKTHLSICYMIVVNGEIKKIGQTSGKDGILGCMSLYGAAGQDDPSISRFGVISLVREEMKNGNTVEVYFQYEEQKTLTIKGAIGDITVPVPISAKVIEDNCVEHYKEVSGVFPEWCFQENGQSWPLWVVESFTDYNSKRTKFKRLQEEGKK